MNATGYPDRLSAMTLTLQRAIAIATQAHAGQFDRDGRTPYIEHPLAVMGAVQAEDAKVVAVLHDLVEDTRVTLDDLRAAGATPAQLAALDALTRRPGEDYRDYVIGALADPIARVVKIADHDHNADPARLARLEPAEAGRLHQKYASVADLIAAAREQAPPS